MIIICVKGNASVVSDTVLKEGENNYWHCILVTSVFAQGFKNHELIENVLDCPGSCDLTANVDFAFLKRSADARSKLF